MKILILGAGELGKKLAQILSNDRHDLVLVDNQDKTLGHILNRHDVMVVQGNVASIESLKEAGIKEADLLLAVSGDEAANVLACQIAQHFKVPKAICRLYSADFFSDEDGFTPSSLGISSVIIPNEECVRKILNVIGSPNVVDKIKFSNKEAIMTAVDLPADSRLCGVELKNFPAPELLTHVRFSAIIRNRKMVIPLGDTVFMADDEVYIAGPKDKVATMIEWLTPTHKSNRRIIIAGATSIGKQLAKRLQNDGYEIRVIEKDGAAGERLLNDFPKHLMVIHGDPNGSDILSEAGVENCDTFISTLKDDEDNILSCILARKLGARKVISVTNKAEYIDIVPEMDMIDTGFSTTLSAVNSVLRDADINPVSVGIDAVLHRFNAFVYEFKVTAESPICNLAIKDCKFPKAAVFSLIFRGEQVFVPTGDLVIEAGDVVAIIAEPETAKALKPLFAKKGLFNR
ncbi:Trk system potassium transport protein TrkA [bacterium M21]|nr:Trk system potassium transport protein TrkA [bacterium M21]